MSKSAVVDTHLHLWDTHKLRYPWLDNIPKLNHSFLPDAYRAACETVNIEAMVFVQCEAEPAMAEAEVDWVHELAKNEKGIKGVVAWAPLERGESSRSTLEMLQTKPLVKGVRRLIQSEPDPAFCLQPQFIEGVRGLEEFGFTFDICIDHTQLANTVKMVQACPGVSFVLDHIAKPDIKRQVLEPWKEELQLLAELPNVCCKVSGLVTEADMEAWQPRDLQPYIDHVIECFGFDRIMFGGDWPVCTLASTYRRWIETLEEALAGYRAEEKQKLFHDNAVDVYRLEI
ncbi:MAG: amidohydrolase family protein [Kiritimatiellae bacterium]|nr:amidohydrolase family protein [Kiritimatiellia bacterium]